MTLDPETAHIVRGWLRDGPARLPDHVLREVLDQAPAIPQRKRGWPWLPQSRNALAFGSTAAVAVALLAVLVLANANLPSVGPGPTASPAATASTVPSPTGLPSPAPSIGPTSSPPTSTGAFSNPWLAVVTVDALNVRVAPSTSAAMLDAADVENPLRKGSRVLVLDEPVQADGYRWYPVGANAGGTSVGWVASGTTSEAWLSPDEARCPEASFTAIVNLAPIQRLACYRSNSLAFVARQKTMPVGTGITDDCDRAQPSSWLVCSTYSWVTDGTGGLLLHFDPATGIEPTGMAPPGTTGPAYEIRGHFNDAASVACATDREPSSVASMGAQLQCATQFVVEALQPIAPPSPGTPPTPSPTKATARCGFPTTVLVLTGHDPAWPMMSTSIVDCLGRSEIRVTGWLAEPWGIGWGSPGVEPAWLGDMLAIWRVLWLKPMVTDGCYEDTDCLWMHLTSPNASSLPLTPDRWVTITGHFDDPAAATCYWTGLQGGYSVPLTKAQAVAECRSHFVVTAIEDAAPAGPSQFP